MKIAVVGLIHLTIEMDVDNEFDPYGTNTGYAKTSYGGCFVDLCEKLIADGHEVALLAPLGYRTFVNIMKVLRQKGINTDYITVYGGGLVLDLQWNTPDEDTIHMLAGGSFEPVVDTLRVHEDSIFEGLDVMIIPYIDYDMLETCKKHGTKLYFYSSDEDLEFIDEDERDFPFIQEVPHFIVDNYREVMYR